MDHLFRSIEGGEGLAGLVSEAFLQKVTAFLSELNASHSFREGNGRAQLAFVGLVGATFGHPFSFERLDKETYLPEIIASYFGNRKPLRDELDKLLS
jgi:cell filamentation protein